jgi:hypothetical protein
VPGYVEKLLGEHYSGTVNHSAQIWNLLCFQTWHEVVVEGRSSFFNFPGR